LIWRSSRLRDLLRFNRPRLGLYPFLLARGILYLPL
jgi:hypothetical protein